MKKLFCLSISDGTLQKDIGLLLLRIGVGLMMAFSHGLGKITKYFSGDEIQFLDPIGIGESLSLFLAGSSEFFCSLALVIGLATRIVSVPLIVTMVVAAFIVHADDPFQKKEFALLYLVPFITLFFAGAGRFSVDRMMLSKNR